MTHAVHLIHALEEVMRLAKKPAETFDFQHREIIFMLPLPLPTLH